MTKEQKDKLLFETVLTELQDRGFDNTKGVEGWPILPACSQCVAMVINGTSTHEHGCRNTKVLVECWECGCEERWLPPGSRFVCDDCANPEVYETEQEPDEEDYDDDDDDES